MANDAAAKTADTMSKSSAIPSLFTFNSKETHAPTAQHHALTAQHHASRMPQHSGFRLMMRGARHSASNAHSCAAHANAKPLRDFRERTKS
jgi:hypothetical protein